MDVPVSTAAELVDAIDQAAPGDVILLAPGVYALTGASCDVAGTQALPIVVRSTVPLGARIDLDSLEGFRVTGAHWRFEGLDVHGVCAVDDDCEHAFHVSGDADGFVLRDSRVVDFNAQLKVNAAMVGGVWETPDAGLIEGNELFDTRARQTGNPTTKLNIDTGDDWIVRRNDLHDFEKAGGDGVSYGAFLKSGGQRGRFEGNLVRCTTRGEAGTRIGLSLGGGGTAPQFCAPAFDASVPCAVEHDGGVIAANVIVGCSDVGIYLNRAANTKVLYNTLIATTGVDFRFGTTTGEAVGNVLASMIRERDGGTFTGDANLENVDAATFAAWYADPATGDLAVVGDVAPLIGVGPVRSEAATDYCGRPRPSDDFTLGAIEHSLGACGDEPLAPDEDLVTDEPPAAGCCQTGGGDPSALLFLALLALSRRARTRRCRG